MILFQNIKYIGSVYVRVYRVLAFKTYSQRQIIIIDGNTVGIVKVLWEIMNFLTYCINKLWNCKFLV